MAAASTSKMDRMFDTSSDSITKSSTTKARKPQVDTRPNRTLATCINNRVVRGIGKTFLALFTVPAMVALEALTGFVAGATFSSILIVAPVYAKTKTGALALAVTVAPIIGLVFGISFAIYGAIDGMKRGVLMAYNGSCKEFKKLANITSELKKDSKIFASDLVQGKSITKTIAKIAKPTTT